MACNDDSACINRLTSIECVNWKCFCGKDCRNQRFQKREYAKVDVILTEKKGYGLRALEYIPHGSLSMNMLEKSSVKSVFEKS